MKLDPLSPRTLAAMRRAHGLDKTDAPGLDVEQLFNDRKLLADKLALFYDRDTGEGRM